MGACQSSGRAIPSNRLTIELSRGLVPPDDYLGQSAKILDELPKTTPTKGNTTDGIDIESAYTLLDPGYTVMEDGFIRLQDGTLYLACYIGLFLNECL